MRSNRPKRKDMVKGEWIITRDTKDSFDGRKLENRMPDVSFFGFD